MAISNIVMKFWNFDIYNNKKWWKFGHIVNATLPALLVRIDCGCIIYYLRKSLYSAMCLDVTLDDA